MLFHLIKYVLYTIQDAYLMLFDLFRKLKCGKCSQIHCPVSYPIVFGT